MTDKSVEREIEANEQRDAENRGAEGESSVAASLGSAAASLTNLIRDGVDDTDADRETLEERRAQNDAEQRPPSSKR